MRRLYAFVFKSESSVGRVSSTVNCAQCCAQAQDDLAGRARWRGWRTCARRRSGLERFFTRRRGDAENFSISLLPDLFSASPRLRVKQVSVRTVTILPGRSFAVLHRSHPTTPPRGGACPERTPRTPSR